MILVGEIRDLETAEIAVQASLTGHLVFSTLHTNDAPSTITRLRDMGVPTVPDHRHGRGDPGPAAGAARSAPTAATEFEPSREMLMELELTPERGGRQEVLLRPAAASAATTPATRAAWACSS